ncbi:MAG: helix-turn-helix transcriptional regulator [Bacillota bacterium]|nr:helix-turn-helix transcriptional regulator [Bacillota bacterium]
MSRLGTEISRLRKEKGMTQKQLAKLAGVAESFIDQVESGRKVLNGTLLARITRILGQEESNYDIYENDEKPGDNKTHPKGAKNPPKPVQQVWNDALDSILKAVPVYDYKMDKLLDTRQLPVISNKIEGFPKDKVFYLQLEDNDMSGFRLLKGDLVLACSTAQIEKDALYFIEYNETRVIRQIKVLGSDRILLVSNRGNLSTETAELKNVKVIGKLIRLEVKL